MCSSAAAEYARSTSRMSLDPSTLARTVRKADHKPAGVKLSRVDLHASPCCAPTDDDEDDAICERARHRRDHNFMTLLRPDASLSSTPSARTVFVEKMLEHVPTLLRLASGRAGWCYDETWRGADIVRTWARSKITRRVRSDDIRAVRRKVGKEADEDFRIKAPRGGVATRAKTSKRSGCRVRPVRRGCAAALGDGNRGVLCIALVTADEKVDASTTPQAALRRVHLPRSRRAEDQ